MDGGTWRENGGFAGGLSGRLSPFRPKGYRNPMEGMDGLSINFIYMDLLFFIYTNLWEYPPYPPILHIWNIKRRR